MSYRGYEHRATGWRALLMLVTFPLRYLAQGRRPW
jgi:hypothetical protein